jgi:hypothetical protein
MAAGIDDYHLNQLSKKPPPLTEARVVRTTRSETLN